MNLVPPVFAQVTPHPVGKLCGDEGLGPFAKFLCNLPTPIPGDAGSNTNNATKTVAAVAFLFSNIVGVLSVVAGIIFVIQFLIGGIGWLTSGGDKAKLESAQQKLINAAVGLIIVLGAYALVNLLGSLLGFDIMIAHPETFVQNLGLK